MWSRTRSVPIRVCMLPSITLSRPLGASISRTAGVGGLSELAKDMPISEQDRQAGSSSSRFTGVGRSAACLASLCCPSYRFTVELQGYFDADDWEETALEDASPCLHEIASSLERVSSIVKDNRALSDVPSVVKAVVSLCCERMKFPEVVPFRCWGVGRAQHTHALAIAVCSIGVQVLPLPLLLCRDISESWHQNAVAVATLLCCSQGAAACGADGGSEQRRLSGRRGSGLSYWKWCGLHICAPLWPGPSLRPPSHYVAVLWHRGREGAGGACP